MDVECLAAETFGWTLAEIDETDMVRMLEFMLYYFHWRKKTSKKPGEKKRQPTMFADEISWL